MPALRRSKPFGRTAGSAEYLRADAARPQDAASAIAAAANRTGASISFATTRPTSGPVHAAAESTEEEWEKCLRVGVMGTHYFTREALPHMVRQKQGSIVNVASIQALAGMMTSAAYTAAKAAVLGYTLSIAYDYGPHNVRVNSLCPGPIRTRISPPPEAPHIQMAARQHGARPCRNAGRGGMGGAVPCVRRGLVHYRRDAARGWRMDVEMIDAQFILQALRKYAVL